MWRAPSGGAHEGEGVQRYEYDARGNIVGVEDGEGNRTAYTADAWGRVTEILKADGSRETYSYDYAGKPDSPDGRRREHHPL